MDDGVPVDVTVDGRSLSVESVGGAAALSIDGLAADTTYVAEIRSASGTDHVTFRTASDIGSVITKFATISDLHLGSDAFGPVGRISEDHVEQFTLRCARAAVHEAQAWGAELLIVKGDITEHGRHAHWELFANLLSEITIPVFAIPGNHDTFKEIDIDPRDALINAGLAADPIQIIDRPGIRIVLGDTSIPGRGMGRLSTVGEELIEAVADTSLPAFVAIHHNIQRTPMTWFWPPGITSVNAKSVVAGLEAANKNIFMSSGHTHRHRRHRIGPKRSILYSEVGSTSDYPGTWAGYEVSKSTIRQTVRRIAEPSVISWTESTCAAIGGVWPRWSQGALDDRCLDLHFE